jgi:hypothetical protein
LGDQYVDGVVINMELKRTGYEVQSESILRGQGMLMDCFEHLDNPVGSIKRD